MLGSSSGNGHPYSWSAIFNGYDHKLMTAECPFAGIPIYLNKEPDGAVGIPGARVTHVCCVGDGGFTAEHVAKCSLIPHVVPNPEDVIGKVDAVIIATDIGSEHVKRARPFIEAGLPVFIDKPLTDNLVDLRQFERWVSEGKALLSSSGMRYAKEFLPYRLSTHELGSLRHASITIGKKWETYGIHGLEAIYPIFGPGFDSVRAIGTPSGTMAVLQHRSGATAVVALIADLLAGFGSLRLVGTLGQVNLPYQDTFYSFKAQLQAFVSYLRMGVRPFPFEETAELMRLLIAGIESRRLDGAEVRLSSLA